MECMETKKACKPAPFSGYTRLLFKSNPTRLDYLLIALGIIFAVAAGIPFPLLGLVLGDLVNNINTDSCEDARQRSDLGGAVDQQIIYMSIIAVANFASLYIHLACWSLVGERLVRRLREQYFRSLLRQELAFFDSLSTGEVTTRLSEHLDAIQAGTSEKVGICITSISYFTAAYVVAFLKSSRIAGILVCLVPAYLFIGVVGGHFHKKYSGYLSDHVSSATNVASDCLSNLSVVLAFGANEKLESIFSSHLIRGQSDGMKKAIATATQFGAMYLIGFSANALAFWQGSREIATAAQDSTAGASVGAIYSVVFLLVDVSYIISQVAPLLSIFGEAARASDKIYETIDRTSEIDGTSLHGKTLSYIRHGICLKDISFTYATRPEMPVLSKVSLTIPYNAHTAIIGISGSGKSTVASLLGRLYDVTSGSIEIDGENIQDLNVRSLRGCIGFVEQNSVLLNLSVLENIAHGLVNSRRELQHLRPVLLDSSLPDLVEKLRAGSDMNTALRSYSPEVSQIVQLVRKSASLSDAIGFIDRLKHGLATNVGTIGSQLSGGQRQRIALARALVGDPPIILLDEATASLDSRSEKKIQDAIARASKGRTLISIAHRLSTVQNADQIVVLQQGRIIEKGCPSDLLMKNGAYAAMIRLQRLKPPQARSEDTISSEDSTNSESTTTTLNAETPPEPLRTTRSSSSLKVGEKPPIHALLLPRCELEIPTAVSTSLENVRPRSLWSTCKGISAMLRPQLLLILIGFTACVVIGSSYSGEAVIFGNTVDSLSVCRPPDAIRSSGRLFGFLFFVLGIGQLLANLISGTAFGWVATKLLFRVRVSAFRALLAKDVQWHESEGRTPAKLLSHLTSDTSAIGSLAGTTIGLTFSIIVSLVVGIVISHIVAWKIAVVLLSVIPVLLGSGFMRLRVLTQFHERHRKAFADSVAITVEAVEAIKTISTCSLEHASLESYRRSLRKPYRATLKAVAIGNIWLAMAFSISILVYALAYWWGTRQIIEGTYTQTQFFIVLPALLIAAQSSGQLFSLAPDMTKARVAAGNILDLLADGSHASADCMTKKAKFIGHGLNGKTEDLEATATAGMGRQSSDLASKRGMEVSLSNVHFSYPARPDVEVLRGLDLSIHAGQFCALVGPSGSGKSTIISLLERFYIPATGSIDVDGISITNSTDITFRNRVALVPQEGTLFDETVRLNIGIGSFPGTEATQEQIEEACRLANIHDVIMSLPKGYETRCGSHGNGFSGGQRQRLSIARALLRKPRLLLLDETTSALDAESEALFQESLERVMAARGTTVIAVAHRLHTIEKADVIFLIEDGMVVDSGRHEELAERSESYRENVTHQTLGG